MLAEPYWHKPKGNNSREDKAKSLSQQPRHPGVGALAPWHRRRRGKGTTSPTLSYGLPPSPHSITAGLTGSMGKQTLSNLPSKSRVHPALTKTNTQDAFKQQLEKPGAGIPKERECVQVWEAKLSCLRVLQACGQQQEGFQGAGLHPTLLPCELSLCRWRGTSAGCDGELPQLPV